MKYQIGEVRVIESTEASVNPYRADGMIGEPRKAALAAFKRGETEAGLQFWYAPASGGAVRLAGPEAIAWETSGLK